MQTRKSLEEFRDKLVKKAMKKFKKYQDIKNFCFFCWEPFNTTRKKTSEHYLSKWLLREMNLLGREKSFIIHNGKTIILDYSRGKLFACEKCNTFLMSDLENKIKELWKEWNTGVDSEQDLSLINPHTLSAWFAKTLAGVHLARAKVIKNNIKKEYFELIALWQMHFIYKKNIGLLTGTMLFKSDNDPIGFEFISKSKSILLCSRKFTWIFIDSYKPLRHASFFLVKHNPPTYFGSMSIFAGVNWLLENFESPSILLFGTILQKQLRMIFSDHGAHLINNHSVPFKIFSKVDLFLYKTSELSVGVSYGLEDSEEAEYAEVLMESYQQIISLDQIISDEK